MENNLLYNMNGYTPLLTSVDERFHSIFHVKDNFTTTTENLVEIDFTSKAIQETTTITSEIVDNDESLTENYLEKSCLLY